MFVTDYEGWTEKACFHHKRIKGGRKTDTYCCTRVGPPPHSCNSSFPIFHFSSMLLSQNVKESLAWYQTYVSRVGWSGRGHSRSKIKYLKWIFCILFCRQVSIASRVGRCGLFKTFCRHCFALDTCLLWWLTFGSVSHDMQRRVSNKQ